MIWLATGIAIVLHAWSFVLWVSSKKKIEDEITEGGKRVVEVQRAMQALEQRLTDIQKAIAKKPPPRPRKKKEAQ